MNGHGLMTRMKAVGDAKPFINFLCIPQAIFSILFKMQTFPTLLDFSFLFAFVRRRWPMSL